MTMARENEDRGVAPIYQIALSLALILLFVVVSKLYMDGFQEIKRLETKHEAEQKRYTETQQTLARLENEIHLLKTDEGVEMVARDKLRFIRPDEVVVVPMK
jgi:cell division protein FtsB